MALHRSLDECELIARLLHDVHIHCGADVFSYHDLTRTVKRLRVRFAKEGIGFLTKTLPKLGKAFDKALCCVEPLDASKLRFKTQPNSKLPRFLGELFKQVLTPDGIPLDNANVTCVTFLRQILYCFYKYELPYDEEQEQQVVQSFIQAENELTSIDQTLREIESALSLPDRALQRRRQTSCVLSIAREAKILLSRVFASFNPLAIHPRHGPGAVATRQLPWDKYRWTNVSAKITRAYPIDAYYFASLGHLCDSASDIQVLAEESIPARVCLVPKDSRGPRLISCEPVDIQWVQQGLGRAIVSHVEALWESNKMPYLNVFFTEQNHNQIGALYGSLTGHYATLDLKEASDRVSLSLVRLLFPPHIYEYLEACRSSSTTLPNGDVLPLQKFAPMGSALCFPILALTVWALLAAGAGRDEYTRDRILVYGDDVVVPTAYAENAMNILESFGLKINRDKSCTKGFFRESCGVDAFKGINVTPIRIRTVWSSTRAPDAFSSWLEYARSFYEKRHFGVYNYIVEALVDLYGPLPEDRDRTGSEFSLPYVPVAWRPPRRWHTGYQKFQYKTLQVVSKSVNRPINGWSMLLRYFTETTSDCPLPDADSQRVRHENILCDGTPAPVSLDVAIARLSRPAFTVSSYTQRDRSMLRYVWR